MLGRVVLLRPLPFQQGLGPTVSLLLFPVSDHRVAAVVPDDRCRAEPERPALLLDLPADIDVVAGDRKSTRLNSSHGYISYAVFCLKKKKKRRYIQSSRATRCVRLC